MMIVLRDDIVELLREVETSARADLQEELADLTVAHPELNDQITRIGEAATGFAVQMVEAASVHGLEFGGDIRRLVCR